MNNGDFTFYFLIVSMINLSIGLDNNEKNIKQEQKQLEIDDKLNKILELLDGRE